MIVTDLQRAHFKKRAGFLALSFAHSYHGTRRLALLRRAFPSRRVRRASPLEVA